MNNAPNEPQSLPPHPSSNPSSRAWIIWLGVFGLLILLILFKDRMDFPAEVVTQARFEELLASGAVKQAIVKYGSQSALNTISGLYYITNGSSVTVVPFRAKVRLTPLLESRIFSYPQFEPHESDSFWLSIAASVLPFVVIAALIWFFFIRQIKKAGLKPNPQHERFDQILSRWEAQITRMDAILDKWEKSQRGP